MGLFNIIKWIYIHWGGHKINYNCFFIEDKTIKNYLIDKETKVFKWLIGHLPNPMSIADI